MNTDSKSLITRRHWLQDTLIMTGTAIMLPALAQTPRPNPSILMMGDSLSAEYGLAKDQGWIKLLERQLSPKYPTWRWHNASISGETTQGGLTRLPAQLEQQRPSVVILELGANDALRGLNPAHTRSNLETMIRLSKRAGAQVLLIGVAMPSNFGKAFTEAHQRIFVELGAQESIPVVPSLMAPFGLDERYFQSDRIHPNEQAQPMMATLVQPQLAKLLAKAPQAAQQP